VVFGTAAILAHLPRLRVRPSNDRVARRERQIRLARDWARRNGLILVEASLLVADATNGRAATVLVRQLLAPPTRAASAVLARPRDERVARMYEVLGFEGITDAADGC